MSIPENGIAIPDIAPISSPSSSAVTVPSAWEELPIAIPEATGSSSFRSFMRTGASMLPNKPESIRAHTVIPGIPPRDSDMASAIGVVTDFGTSEAVSLSSRPRIFDSTNMEITDTAAPTVVPKRIAMKFFFTSALCL